MFKFDFKADAEGESLIDEQTKQNTKNETNSLNIEWNESEEIYPNEEMLENLDVCRLNATQHIVGDITLSYMVSGFLLQDITSNEDTTISITKAEKSHSDLIPGVYEGGAKVWECTFDLLKYMNENFKADTWKGQRVLDLGCGAGVLGIYTYKHGAYVQFQDYNKDVLEKITIPNVLLNIPKPPIETDLNLSKLKNEVQFYSGDWGKYTVLTSQHEKFDFILTSETVYNPQNQQKLLNVFGEKLSKEGVVLVAAKTYYFGVGGGLRQFESLIKDNGRFKSNVVWTSSEGVSREILELRRN